VKENYNTKYLNDNTEYVKENYNTKYLNDTEYVKENYNTKYLKQCVLESISLGKHNTNYSKENTISNI
jgi:hypothetical protein